MKPGKRRNPVSVTCALPGCEESVAQIPGNPPRSFCSPDHRAAARQLGVQEALRAAASVDSGPGPSDVPLDAPSDAPDNGGARAHHSRRLTLRPALTAVAALTAIGGAVPAVLLLGGSGGRPEHAPAHGSPTQTPRSGSGQDQLLAESASWSAGAQQALAGIASQLPALYRAEKAIEDVPANRRSTRADTLLRKVRQRISCLTGRQASLGRPRTVGCIPALSAGEGRDRRRAELPAAHAAAGSASQPPADRRYRRPDQWAGQRAERLDKPGRHVDAQPAQDR
jgi:hypothetical protein